MEGFGMSREVTPARVGKLERLEKLGGSIGLLIGVPTIDNPLISYGCINNYIARLDVKTYRFIWCNHINTIMQLKFSGCKKRQK